jgi:hypothetical protein
LYAEKIIKKYLTSNKDINKVLDNVSNFLFHERLSKYRPKEYIEYINDYKNNIENQQSIMAIQTMDTFKDELPEDVINYMKHYVPINNTNNSRSFKLTKK